MTGPRPLLVAVLVSGLLVGCGVDRAAERRELVAELTQAVNERDADRVREQAQTLMIVVTDHHEKGELSAEQAERLTLLAQKVEQGADLIDEQLQARLKAEADAAAATKKLEEAQRQLEQERREAEDRQDDDDKGKGKKDGDGDD